MDFLKRYDNGLSVAVREMEGLYSTSVAVAVNVGSSVEPPECNGYSHFIEHMLFKGTPSRSASKISETIEDVGGQLNAYTSKDVTCFYTKTAGQHTRDCLELLSDMFFNSVFDETELDRERQVVIEEITMGEDLPDDVCHDLLCEALYGEGSLGRTITGPKSIIERATREELLEFKRKHYTAPNVCISVAGNVKTDEVLKYVEEFFVSKFDEMPKAEKDEPLAVLPVYGGVYLRKKKDSEQAYVCLGCNSQGVGDPLNYPNNVLSGVLGGGMSSRLFQSLREKQGLCYSVYSYLSAYKNNGYHELYVGTSPSRTGIAVKALRDEMDRFFEQPITDAELNRGKEQYKGSMLLSLENSINVAMLMANSVLKLDKLIDIDERIRMIDAVTKEDVMKAAERLLDPRAYSMAYVGKNSERDLLKLFRGE